MSETHERLKARLAKGYAIVGFCVLFGLSFYYLIFGFSISGQALVNSIIYFSISAPLFGGMLSIYLPLKSLKTEWSLLRRVVIFNALAVILIYGIFFYLSYLWEIDFHDILKIPFIALSVGILQCLLVYMFTLEALYPYVKNSEGTNISLYYKNLFFIISIVAVGVIVAGASLINSMEYVLKGGAIAATLLRIVLACFLATVIVAALSRRYTNLMKLPLRELAHSVKAVSEGKAITEPNIPKTGDEILALINSFNEMAEKVREREDELMLKGQQLALLYSFATALNQNKSLKELFDMTMDWINETFGLEIGALRLTRNGFLRLEASRGLSEEDIRNVEIIKSEDSLAGLAIMKNEAVIVDDVCSFGSRFASVAKSLGLECVISIPLRCKGKIIGSLTAASRSKRDVRSSAFLLNSLSNLLGIAVERSLEVHQVVEEKFQWETAISHIRDIVSIHDSQWRIKKVNPAFVEYFGLKEEDVIGKYCYEVFHGSDAPPNECPNLESLITRKKATQTLTLSSGREYAVAVHPIIKQHGAYDGCIHIARDVTEVMRLREKIHRADKLSALGRLAAGIAHNVNNPLTYSLNYMYLLKESAKDEEIKEIILKAEQGIEKAKMALEQLLEFSMPVGDDCVVVDVEAVVDETVMFLSAALAEKGVLINKIFTEKLFAKASKNGLEQVLINLITNAADAGATEIKIEGYADPADVNIIVTDNGLGIEPEHMKRIFEPYFTTKPKGKGTGLGLYVSYNIINSFGGNIWCSSKKGVGTQFFISLIKAF